MQLQACLRINYRCAKNNVHAATAHTFIRWVAAMENGTLAARIFLANWAFKGLLNYLILNWGCVVRRSSRLGVANATRERFLIYGYMPGFESHWLKYVHLLLHKNKSFPKLHEFPAPLWASKRSHKNKVGKGGWAQSTRVHPKRRCKLKFK